MSQKVNSKDGINFCHAVYPLGTPEDFRFCVVKGSNQSSLFELRPDRVKHYDVTLDALTLKPSDVCNVGVNMRHFIQISN